MSGPTHGTLTPSIPGNYQSAVYQPTPGYAGPDSYTYSATGPGGTSATAAVSITVGSPTITITPASLAAGQAGTAYSDTLAATGGTAAYSFSATGLPTGLTLATNGALAGTPTQAGSFTVVVTVQDSSTGTGPFTGSKTYTLAIAVPTIAITPVALPAPVVGVAYAQAVSASGGISPFSYAVTLGALPAGLTLSTTGTVSGTPTAGGSFTATITATDSSGFTGSRAYSLTVAAPSVTLAPSTLPAGASGVAYSQALVASGGTAPYSYAVTAGALPAGVTLSASGTLAGTPTASGSFAFSVTATDSSTGSGPYAATRSYTLVIAAPTLVLAPATLAGASVGTAYSEAIVASGGTAPYSYAVTSGALPAGVTLSASGTLSGTPSAGGSFAFTVTATDATAVGSGGPYTASRAYSLTVAAPSVTLAPTTLPAGSSGVAYSQALVASGGTAPYSYAVTAGALPAGVTLSASGTLAGTPTASGSFAFSVSATDSSGGSGPYAATRSYTLVIAAPTLALAPATLAGASVGTAYSETTVASGGTAPYSYAVTAGALPAGVTLSANGTLSGTPTAGGSFAFTVTATDATAVGSGGPYTASRAYSLTVAAPSVTLAPTSLPAGASGVAYSQALVASGGTAPYSYAVTAGALPAGVTLSASGTLAGTPTASGSFAFSVTATDSSSGSGPYAATRSYTLVIAAPTLALAPATLAGASVGTAYSASVVASGGTAPYSYAVTAGALPAGVTLSASGALSGTPSAGGSFAFTVTAADATVAGSGGPYTASRAYSLTVAAPSVTLAPASLPAGSSGVAYSQALVASGGTAPYSYAVTAGALPAGVTLSASGTLAGTPTTSGNFAFSVTATDSSGGSGPYAATRSYTLVIAAPTLALAPATLAGASVGTAYSEAIVASGGTAPYSYAVTAGALPVGVTLSASGTLAGTPTAGGSFAFTVTATDATAVGSGGPYTASRAYSLTVAAPSVTLAPSTLPAGSSGIAYNQALVASGGTAPYSYGVTAGALPAGLTLSASGSLAGTPLASGSFAFSVTATDSSTGSGPYAATRSYTLVVAPPTLALAPATLAGASVGTAYSETIVASGGTAPYSYAVTAGGLPAGVTLSASGTLAGTPTAGGSFAFTVTATDATAVGSGGPYTASRAYSLTVAAPSVTLAPTSLPAGASGVTYSQALVASGGTAPYSYAVTAGALPAGVTLLASGTLAGTPTASGSFAFSVTATDSSGGSGPYAATRSYTLVIAAPTLALAPATLAGASVGTAYSETVVASGGTAPYSYVVTAGALPTGVTLSTSGTLAGTPSAGGSFAFTVTAADATAAGSGGPYTASRAYSLTVAAPSVTLAPSTLPAGASGVAYSQALVAGGGTAPYSYAITSGALPAGVTLSAAGTLAGTPTASGSFAFSVTATDSSGGSGPYVGMRSYTLVVAAPTPPVAADTSLTVAYGAGATPVLLSISGPAATSVAVASGPAHGSAVVTGLSITYAPAAGYAGTDSFTYTATNPGGTSAPATVTISVTPPPAPVSADRSVTTAYGTAASIDLSGAITGVRTTIAIGSAVTHGTTSISGEVVTYTPAAGYYGQDSFTYSASGPGGASAPATVTITVAAPVIAIAPATLPAGQQGVAYTATLSASGGAAPYRFAVTAGALPAGLDLSAAGQLAGTPTQSGTFAVTITATDSSIGATPATAAQSYTLLVAAPAPPIATGTAVTVTSPAGGTRPVDIVLSTLVTGEWTSIAAANAPAHGTVTLAATPGGGAGGRPLVVATYTPTIGYRGPDSFGFAANGPGGRSALATVAITVLGSVPVAPTLTASTGQNVPVTIDLTAQARGAPFTAAAIVSVGPSGAATAALIEGGTADARTYRLQVTPEPRYSGTIVVTYTLSNAVGASAAATATVTVTARADPAADPTVSGLVGAQAEATRSFAATQLGNFARRNESLHGGGGGSAGRPFGVRITNGLGIFGNVGGYQPSGVDRETALKMEHATEVAGAESLYGSDGLIRTGLVGGGLGGNGLADIAARNVGPTQDRAAPGSGQTPSGTTGGSNATTGSGSERDVGSVAIWSGGAVTVGSRDATTGRVHLDVTSGGLSAGSDVKLSDSLTIGIGGGYGNQRTRIGNGAARLDGDNWVGAIYGSLASVPGAFVDGVIGYGEVGFDSRRRAPNGAIGVGHRDGTMRFGSLAAGLDRQGQSGMISAYGRMEYLSATLDGYREMGAGLYDLAYGRRELDSLSSVLGGRGALYRPIDFGILTPRIRFEWRHEYRGQGNQLLDYADLGGLTRVVEGDRWLRDEYGLELGLGLETASGWTFGLDFGGRLGSDSQVGTARATVAKKF